MIIYRYTSSRKSRRGIPPAQRRVKDTRARTHAHTHMRPARRLSPRVCVAEGIQARARAHTHTHTHTHTQSSHTSAHIQARSRTRLRARARTHARSHARTRTHTGRPPGTPPPGRDGFFEVQTVAPRVPYLSSRTGRAPRNPPAQVRCAALARWPLREPSRRGAAAGICCATAVILRSRRGIHSCAARTRWALCESRVAAELRVFHEAPERNSVSFMKLRNGTPCLS